MAVKKDTSLLKQLKRQVRDLHKTEQQGRRKLRTVLKKMIKMARSYKIKLENKVHEMQSKITSTHSSDYVKAASSLEHKVLKKIKKKGKKRPASVSKKRKAVKSRRLKPANKKLKTHKRNKSLNKTN